MPAVQVMPINLKGDRVIQSEYKTSVYYPQITKIKVKEYNRFVLVSFKNTPGN